MSEHSSDMRDAELPVSCRSFGNHEPERDADPVETVARLASAHGLWVGVAESLTSGRVACRLGEGDNASSWFRGGVIAYDERVKYDVLGVDPGPVVTERCAEQMAAGAARLLGADAVVALTGVGGPDPAEGQAPGTVLVAVQVGERVACAKFLFAKSPEDVLTSATERAVEMLASMLRRHGQD
jgi:nicotinamide-nucleotide amidase